MANLKRLFRGQASLEFLMTYGWGILTIGIVLVVAWQVGLFDIRGANKPGSVGFWGVIPTDFIYDAEGNFYLSIRNTVGAEINVIGFNVTMGERQCWMDYSGAPEILPAGSNTTLSITQTGGATCLGDKFPVGLKAGSSFELFTTITYEDTRDDSHTFASSGIVWGSVES
ncbi:MAG: hypothetical protein ABH950_07915 [Candidatus Altiarchaeota archaeon]